MRTTLVFGIYQFFAFLLIFVGFSFYYHHKCYNPNVSSTEALVVRPVMRPRLQEGFPFVVMGCGRPDLLYDTLNSIKRAIEFEPIKKKHACIFTLDGAPNASRYIIDSIDWCDVKKLEFSNNGEYSVPHLHYHWWWLLDNLFNQTKLLGNYEGDILILEDDVQIAPDAFIAMEFLSAIKKNASWSIVAGFLDYFKIEREALGGWGGEHLINADPKTFVMQQQHETFPNMGYIVNKTTYKYLLPFKEECLKIAYERDWGNGWDYCVGTKMDIFKLPPIVFRPTYTRVWHTGGSGKGRRGKYLTTTRAVPVAPWAEDPLYVPLNISEARLKDGMRNVFGIICPNFNWKRPNCDWKHDGGFEFSKRYTRFCFTEPGIECKHDK